MGSRNAESAIYLVAGTCRTGKSTMARRVRKADPSVVTVSLDSMRTFLEKIDNAPSPTVGSFAEKADGFYPLLRSLTLAHAWHHRRILIEGDLVMPRHVVDLQADVTEAGFDRPVKACFIVISRPNLKKILKTEGEGAWLFACTLEEQQGYMTAMEEYSQQIIQECEQYGIPYFDLSKNWRRQHSAAFRELLNGVTLDEALGALADDGLIEPEGAAATPEGL